MLKTNLSQKKSITILIIIGAVILSFAVYSVFFYIDTKDIEKEQEEDILSEEERRQMDELQQIREERRGEDYEELTEEEREADMERQIQELQDLRRR